MNLDTFNAEQARELASRNEITIDECKESVIDCIETLKFIIPNEFKDGYRLRYFIEE